jgi:hypothetical protein
MFEKSNLSCCNQAEATQLKLYVVLEFRFNMGPWRELRPSSLKKSQKKRAPKNRVVLDVSVANIASYAICSKFDFGDSWQHDHWD